MLNTSSTFKDSFDKDSMVRPIHKVEIEWNINRYANSVVVTNGGAVESDPDLFPLKSIVEPTRGVSGVRIVKTGDDLDTADHNLLASPDSKYKYWVSSTRSSSASPYTITGVNPQVMYDAAWTATSVRVVFERSTSVPTDFTIETTANGTTWTTIATNPGVDSYGVVSVPTTEPVRGIRLNVTRMNKANAYCEVIEIGARRTVDISTRIKSFTVSMESNDIDIFRPVGAITTNTASVQIDNSDQAFNPDNSTSPYYGLLGAGAVIKPYVGLNLQDRGAGVEYVQQGEYYTSPWGSDSSSLTVNVSCRDGAYILQAVKLGPMLFIDKTVPEIIKALCGSVGFNKLRFINNNSKSEFVIPYVFFEDGKTVWENLQSIITADQGALSFFEDGFLVYTSREDVIAPRVPIYVIRGEAAGEYKANLKSISQEFSYSVNKVDVNYKKYESRENAGIPIDSILWEPEDDVSLRADPLKTGITSTQDFFFLESKNAEIWPYQGLVNMDGEVMSYDGKEYKYLNPQGAFLTGIVKTQKEKDTFDDLNPGMKFKNYFSGKFVNVKRGLYGTPNMSHYSVWQGYTAKRSLDNSTLITNRIAETFLPGVARIAHPAVKDGEENSKYTMWKTGTSTSHYKLYGARFKFNAASSQGIFGIQYNSGTGGREGLFAEIRTTAYCESKKRKINEAGAFWRGTDASAAGRGGRGINGIEMPIVEERWYTLEVSYNASTQRHTMYLDGIVITQWAEQETFLTDGYFGFYVRGGTSVDVDHFYAVNPPFEPIIDSEIILDTITGGYISNYMENEPYANWRRSAEWKKTGMIFDDMGATVHELREFDVKYDKVPALSSKLYLSNSRIKVAEMTSTPFSAKFILANAWKDTAIVNGEDKTLFQSDASVEQKLMVYGQLIEKTDEQKVTATDEAGIRREGEEYLEFDSEWIQTEDQAKALADFVKNRWSTSKDVLTISGYFNPAIQIGDLVSVYYPLRDMETSTHEYIVLSKQLEYGDGGLSVTLTIVRVMV